MASETPLRQQYLRIKRDHPDALLLFRMGDFYETFDEDARLAARELEIALTSREMGKGQRVPLAGIPYHALESYLARLVRRGHRVAICEQVGDTSAPGLVERRVVRVVTPGTLTETSLLEQSANNYLVAVMLQGAEAGLAYVDITTGEFATTQLSVDDLPLELERLGASEVVAPEGCDVPPSGHDFLLTPLEPATFRHADAEQALLEHFGTATLEAYGCHNLPLAVGRGGSNPGIPQQNAKSSLGTPAGAAHVLAAGLHGAGPADEAQPGAVPGGPVGRVVPLPPGHNRPYGDADGRPPAAQVARPAPVGPGGAGAQA